MAVIVVAALLVAAIAATGHFGPRPAALAPAPKIVASATMISTAEPGVRPTERAAFDPNPYPTEWDEAAELRAEAAAFAGDDPETKDASIIPVITDYLQSDDPYVRMMGASSVLVIGGDQTVADSSLRDAVRADARLVDALYAAIEYHPSYGLDTDSDECRETAVQALFSLFRDLPSARLESALTAQFEAENSPTVRSVLVAALGYHEFTSEATEAVFLDASQSHDEYLADQGVHSLEKLRESRDDSPDG